MKVNIYIIMLAISLVAVNGCKKFEEINTNPNASTKVTSAMLATSMILNVVKQPTQKGFMQHDFLSKYIAWNENIQDYQYNSFGRVGFGGFTILNQVPKMVEYATTPGLKNSYEGLGHFIRAYKFVDATMSLGDIPYSEAIRAEEDNIYNPKYDTQKAVFIGVLNELDKADQLFATGSDFNGDPTPYAGKAASWRKLVNSFQLQVLMYLSKKADDPDLNIKGRFQTIVSSRPLMTSNGDNFGLAHSNKDNQKYPFFKEGNSFVIYPMVTGFIIDLLKERNDNRLFYYANPSPVQITAGKLPSEFAAYKGPDPAAEYSVITSVSSSKDYSKINNRYTEIPEGEPTYMLSYAMVNFIRSEAAVRGWTTDNAKDMYEKGIRAAMEFVATYTPSDVAYTHGRSLDNTYINSYFNEANVAFPIAMEDRIKQIVTQKYISTYMQAPFSAYLEYRRTGYPVFPINPLSNLNAVKEKLPQRWMYAQEEYNYNGENVSAAVQRQFAGNDDTNQLMWLLK